jgi:hypothetical protein
MLFHITQTHTPETCPKEEGGSKVLVNPKAEGTKLRGMDVDPNYTAGFIAFS